jgi:hypothetical protein
MTSAKTEWHLLTGACMNVRTHHEELAAASTMTSALSALVPFAVALWVRIKSTPLRGKPPHKGDV